METKEWFLIKKLFWRIKFILTEAFGKDIDAIVCSLRSSDIRSGVLLTEILDKRNIVKWDLNSKYIRYDNNCFFYSTSPPIVDVIDICFYDNCYIKKNFHKNSAIILEGPYEKNEIKVNEGDYVFDVGANFGIFSVFFSKKVGNQGKVFSFEPIKDSLEILKKNINYNNIRNVEVVNKALGLDNCETTMSIGDDLGQSSGVMKNEKTKNLKVSQITLDYFVDSNNIERVDFIKADIEGMEREMLKGARHVIRKFKPKLSICIYHLDDDPEVIEGIIRDIEPDYKIYKSKTKLYAIYEK